MIFPTDCALGSVFFGKQSKTTERKEMIFKSSVSYRSKYIIIVMAYIVGFFLFLRIGNEG